MNQYSAFHNSLEEAHVQTSSHYSASYKAGDLLFVSGQVGISEGSLADGVAAQTTQALANAESVLSENGLTLADVMKCTVFMTDIENFFYCQRRLCGSIWRPSAFAFCDSR